MFIQDSNTAKYARNFLGNGYCCIVQRLCSPSDTKGNFNLKINFFIHFFLLFFFFLCDVIESNNYDEYFILGLFSSGFLCSHHTETVPLHVISNVFFSHNNDAFSSCAFTLNSWTTTIALHSSLFFASCFHFYIYQTAFPVSLM